MEQIREEFINGKSFLIDKEFKWTSFDVINKIRLILNKRLGIKKIKVGHTGTLDPLATGLMIICTGKATKNIENYLNLDKEYIFTMKLGETTASFDLETEINTCHDPGYVTLEMIKEAIKKYQGEFLQIPPVFSAKYINGKRAYEYARKGKNINLDPVQVNISDMQIVNFNNPLLTIRVTCSKGTYIRSLARDIGNDLKCGAHITMLRRTSIGSYNIANAITLDEFEKKLIKSET